MLNFAPLLNNYELVLGKDILVYVLNIGYFNSYSLFEQMSFVHIIHCISCLGLIYHRR